MGENSNRILVLISAFRPLIGGAEIALEEIVQRLPHIHFDIVTPRYRPEHIAVEELYSNVTVHRTGSGSWLEKYLFFWRGYARAHLLHQQHAYTVCHAYQASFGGLVGRRLKRAYPALRFVLTLQEGGNLQHQAWLIRRIRAGIIAAADIITGISTYLTEYARQYNAEAKIILIPNGVDGEVFRRVDSSALRDQLGVAPASLVLVSVSRLVDKNGLDILLRAFADIQHNRTRSMKLVIVGEGPLGFRLQSLARQLRVESHVIFAGAIPNHQLPMYLSLADIFVRPSRSEGLGTAFLEAMAVGVPVIGTGVGGITDFLIDKETGFLWRPSEGTLAQTILSACDDEVLRTRVALNGQKMVFERFQWNSIAHAMNQLYFSI